MSVVNGRTLRTAVRISRLVFKRVSTSHHLEHPSAAIVRRDDGTLQGPVGGSPSGPYTSDTSAGQIAVSPTLTTRIARRPKHSGGIARQHADIGSERPVADGAIPPANRDTYISSDVGPPGVRNATASFIEAKPAGRAVHPGSKPRTIHSARSGVPASKKPTCSVVAPPAG